MLCVAILFGKIILQLTVVTANPEVLKYSYQIKFQSEKLVECEPGLRNTAPSETRISGVLTSVYGRTFYAHRLECGVTPDALALLYDTALQQLLLANLVNAPLTLNKRFSASNARMDNEDGCAGCLKIF